MALHTASNHTVIIKGIVIPESSAMMSGLKSTGAVALQEPVW